MSSVSDILFWVFWFFLISSLVWPYVVMVTFKAARWGYLSGQQGFQETEDKKKGRR